MPIRCSDQTWAKTDIKKAELFAEHLCNVFKPYDDVIDHEFVSSVKESLLAPLPLSLPPKSITINEVSCTILKLPLKKSPGYDLITSEILRQLPYKGLLLLTEIFNAILRLGHFPVQWKVAEIILIHKPDKPTHLVTSYRPISLLPVPSKLFERILLDRILPIIEESVPDHQFGFRKAHSTIHQLHRVTDFIATGLENKQYTSGVFLDVTAAFDKVWHEGLLYKLKPILCNNYYGVIRSFLEDRFFRVRHGSAYSQLKPIEAGVPQGSILSPLFYNIYTSDIPQNPNTIICTYADDTAILSSSDLPDNTSSTLQQHMDEVQEWTKKWRIKINPTKSTQVTFTLRTQTCPPVTLNNTPLSQEKTVRYLGLHLDRRLTWSHHIKCKRLTLNARLKLLFRLMKPKSPVKLNQKLLLYKSLLKPIWCYGLQLFGCAKKSNVNKIQCFQSKVLRLITGAPSYVNNHILHKDLKIPFVNEVAKSHYKKFHNKTTNHTNPLIRHISRVQDYPIRRLNRRWSRDLLR